MTAVVGVRGTRAHHGPCHHGVSKYGDMGRKMRFVRDGEGGPPRVHYV